MSITAGPNLKLVSKNNEVMKVAVVKVVLVLVVLASVAAAAPIKELQEELPQKVERTMKVDEAVTVSVCAASAGIAVEGWDRNEVLARSMEGAQIQLRGDSAKVEVLVVDKEDSIRGDYHCQASTDFELRVPRGATVHVQTRDGSIMIMGVAMAYAGTQDGDINLERISARAEVGSIGGEIMVKDSTGSIDLNSAGGSVNAVNVNPRGQNDSFAASTVSGPIELERIGHAQLNVRSINGELRLTGPLTSGGRYVINTMSGNVTLELPADSSFKLNATVSAQGDVISDFPLTLLSQVVSPPSPVSKPAKPAHKQTPKPPKVKTQPQPAAEMAPMAPDGMDLAPAPSPAPAVEVRIETPQPTPRIVTVKPVVIVTPHSVRRINAVCGSGDAVITVSSFSGTLHLQRN